MDAFTRAYIACALWSSTDENGDSLDDYSIEDISRETLERIEAECKGFQEGSERALSLAYAHPGYAEEQAGHDFWLTRNRHGAGFWDRGLRLRLGKILTQDAHAWGAMDLIVGGDGKIHAA